MAENKSETITFNGMKFYRYPDSGNLSDRKYFRAFPIRGNQCVYLHRAMWERENGNIPDGFDIHHIDGDHLNNTLGNFDCIPQTAHMSEHSKKWYADPENKKYVIQHLEDIRPMTKKWHASEEGIEWHREHAKTSINTIPDTLHTCEFCGKKYMSPDLGHNRFCSNKCKSAYRRQSGTDNVDRICVVCGTTFKINKYYKTKTCSRSCSGKLVSVAMKKRHVKEREMARSINPTDTSTQQHL